MQSGSYVDMKTVLYQISLKDCLWTPGSKYLWIDIDKLGRDLVGTNHIIVRSHVTGKSYDFMYHGSDFGTYTKECVYLRAVDTEGPISALMWGHAHNISSDRPRMEGKK